MPHAWHHAKINLVVGKVKDEYVAYVAGSGEVAAVHLERMEFLWHEKVHQSWNGELIKYCF